MPNKVKRTDDLLNAGSSLLCFHCPGCGYDHAFRVGERVPGKDVWKWNGLYDRPTFTPSLLCNKDVPEARCHLYVIDGQIKFENDCHHKLAGQTVDLPDYDNA